MKLYTIECNGKTFVAAETNNGKLFDLESLGIHVNDMNELIDCEVGFAGEKDKEWHRSSKSAACVRL